MVSPVIPQRQSLPIAGKRIHADRPSAPARWAAAVSTEISRSSSDTTAAVAEKSVSRDDKSCTRPAKREAASSEGPFPS